MNALSFLGQQLASRSVIRSGRPTTPGRTNEPELIPSARFGLGDDEAT